MAATTPGRFYDVFLRYARLPPCHRPLSAHLTPRASTTRRVGQYPTSAIRSQHAAVQQRHSSPSSPPAAANAAPRPSAPPDLPTSTRLLMRSTASPIAVLTTTHPPGRTIHGATLSSISTVCLSPSPTITFNLSADSRTAAGIEASGKVSLHILAANAAGRDIARLFAVPGHGDVEEAVRGIEGHEVLRDGEGGVGIAGPGVLGRFQARLLGGKTVGVAGKKVFFAEVEGVFRPGVEGGEVRVQEEVGGTSLVYVHGEYRRVADEALDEGEGRSGP